MKKILSFLAVTVLAITTVKGAAVDWEIDTYDITVQDGWTVQAYVGDISTAITSWGNATLDLADIISSIGAGVNGTSSMDWDAASGGSTGVSDSDSLTFVIYSGSVEDGGTFYYTSPISISGHTYTPPATGEALLVWSDSFSTGTFAAKGEVVPEPCSVALIALGLAALGLRRKVQA